jgi:hypothetical protein
MQSHRDWFDHRSQGIIEFRRRQMALARAHSDKFRERAVGRWIGTRAAEHNRFRAEIGATATAVATNTAVLRRIHHYPTAHFGRLHIWRPGSYLAKTFMPQDKWASWEKCPALTMIEVMEVRTTDPRSPHPNKHLSRQ